MTVVPISHALAVAAVLFALGWVALLARRNMIFMLVAIEIMVNAAGLAFIAAGAKWGQADGQVMFLFILTMAAAEVAVGLALVLKLREHFQTLDSDRTSTLGEGTEPRRGS